MEDTLFSPENKAKSNFISWKEVGQVLKGTYVEKKIQPNTLKLGTRQTVYTIVDDEGVVFFVSGRGNQDPQVLQGLESAKFGQYVGIRYEGDIAPTKPGMNAAKKIVVYTPAGNMKMDVLAKFRGEDPFEDEHATPDME